MESTVSKTSPRGTLLPTAWKGNHMFICYLESRVPSLNFWIYCPNLQANISTSFGHFNERIYGYLSINSKPNLPPDFGIQFVLAPLHTSGALTQDTNGNSTECLSLPFYQARKFKTTYTSYLNKLRTPSNPSLLFCNLFLLCCQIKITKCFDIIP